MYNFDEIIDRRNTDCIKFDFARERGMPEGLCPLWVADMDFRTPPEVIQRLTEVVGHGIFGYTETKENYFRALQSWFDRRFGYEFKPAWLKKTPGVVFALAAAIRAFSKPRDPVLIQTPVYYPFSGCVKENDRRLIDSPLVYHNGRYIIDFDDLEKKIVSFNIRLMLLCSPHNPVSRVWTLDEIKQLGQICLRHGCVVVSDEIHCDFVFGGRTHHLFTAVDPAFEEIGVLLTAPSKTFNLAGLQVANALIPNQALKRLFSAEVSRTGFSQLNTTGLAACRAAYEMGENWLTELLAYLEGNLELTREFFRSELLPLKLVETEGTYLLWVDFQPLGLSDQQINDLVINQAKLWLDAGTMFGTAGAGFQRINMACPRSVLKEALSRLAAAVAALKK
ncbi:MAG: pyridoxal phosphate-dependent aminotransferase [Deltaproteobacteria bacterium]|jgi:cystathionine beta-lyase|nr:pyridoxal phosphate-dependent aminotransferase [Deltaproteobacteria bacterium]